MAPPADPFSFDRVAARYDADNGYPPSIAATIARGLIAAGPIPPGARVLELAAGSGRITLPLLASGVDVTAVDIAPRMLERLRQGADALRAQHDPSAARLGRLTIREGDITALSDARPSWDIVLAVHVFHLVSAWRQALDEALRVLVPDGALLLGQDQSAGGDPMGEMQERWREIVAELGVPITATAYPGARMAEAIAYLETRGLRVAEHTLATWQTVRTPRMLLAGITERVWSRTWAIPDDIFAESVRRLDAWATRHYGPRLDVPLSLAMSFTVARISR